MEDRWGSLQSGEPMLAPPKQRLWSVPSPSLSPGKAQRAGVGGRSAVAGNADPHGKVWRIPSASQEQALPPAPAAGPANDGTAARVSSISALQASVTAGACTCSNIGLQGDRGDAPHPPIPKRRTHSRRHKHRHPPPSIPRDQASSPTPAAGATTPHAAAAGKRQRCQQRCLRSVSGCAKCRASSCTYVHGPRILCGSAEGRGWVGQKG